MPGLPFVRVYLLVFIPLVELLDCIDRVDSDLLHVRVHVFVRAISSLFHRPHKAGCLLLLSEAADNSEEVVNGLLCCLYVHDQARGRESQRLGELRCTLCDLSIASAN